MANWVYNSLFFDEEEDLKKVIKETLDEIVEDRTLCGSNYNTKKEIDEDRTLCDVEIDENNFRFNTKWSPPEDWYDWLKGHYPDMNFEVRWEEEQGFGAEWGQGDKLHKEYVSWDYPELRTVWESALGWAVVKLHDGDPEANGDNGYYLIDTKLLDPEDLFTDFPECEWDQEGKAWWGHYETEDEARAHIKTVLAERLKETA